MHTIYWGIPEFFVAGTHGVYWPQFGFEAFQRIYSSSTPFGNCNRGGFDQLDYTAGYPFTAISDDTLSYRAFFIAYPEELGEPVQMDILDISSVLIAHNIPFATPDNPGFGKHQDNHGHWYTSLSIHGIRYRVYMTQDQYSVGAVARIRFLTARCAAPTFSPAAGALGSYPASVTISGPAGSEVSYKIFAISDPAEDPTPGSNGWSALVATPDTASVNAGDELRAVAIKPDYAYSTVASAQYT